MITIWVNLVVEVSFLHGFPLNHSVRWWDAMQNVPLCISDLRVPLCLGFIVYHWTAKCLHLLFTLIGVSGTCVLTYRIGRWSRFGSRLPALGGGSGWLPVPCLCPRVSCEGLGWTIDQVWSNGWASPMFWWARQVRLGAGLIKSSGMKIKYSQYYIMRYL